MKYVFLDENYDQGHILMQDLESHEDCVVIYRNHLLRNRFFNRLFLSLFYGRLNKILPKSLKKQLTKIVFHSIINPGVQILSLTIRWYNKEMLDIFKGLCPQAKFVLIMRDTVLRNTTCIKDFYIEEAKNFFDLILSYDGIHDVPTYGLTFAPVYMSKFEEIAESIHTCKYDVAFIAAAKDRLSTIHTIYENLVSKGMKCFFYIFRAPREKQLINSGIIYSEEYLDRFELLKKELESNCILEILKGDAYSNTLRFWEAIIYNKKLYTNWAGVVDTPYYNPRYIRVFENPEDLDYSFIQERIAVEYNYNGELSPLRLLDQIKNVFE